MHLDPRSLALFRMALGGLVFALAWQLRPDYSAFFSSSAYPHLIWALLFFILPIFSALLILGFFSRLCSAVCWAGVLAVQQANPHILYGADALLRLLLFWSIFLPLGASWSMETRLFKRKPLSLPTTDWLGAWAITAQICLLYWFSALAKADPLWTQSHNALFYALSVEDLTSPFGIWLRNFPDLLRWLTAGTLYVEFLGPLLLFVPFYRDHFRLVAVTLFLSFHLIGMQCLMMLGFFPWVCATAWLIFIPGFFWNSLTSSAPVPTERASLPGRSHLLDKSMAVLLCLSLVDILVWNIACLHPGKDSSKSEEWMNKHDFFGKTLHLKQHWRMYSSPNVDHGWLVAPAVLVDGTQVDIFTGQPVSWAKPSNIADYLGKDRWRTYIGDFFHTRSTESIQHYCDYLVGKWNASHPDNQKVKTATLIFMKQVNLPNLTISDPERVKLYEHTY